MFANRPKILVIDDHPLPCDGICSAVEALYPEYRAIGVHSSTAARAALNEGGNWILVLCDVNLPDMDGLQLALEIRVQHKVPVLVITGQDDPLTARNAAKSGASGFLEKSANADTFRAALRTVLAGGRFFPEDAPGLNTVDPSMLSHRQRQILDLVLSGKPNKLIANELGLGDGTVRNHISDLLSLFSITSRTRAELITKAIQLGYKPPRQV